MREIFRPTDPAALAFSVSDLKSYLRVTHTAEDAKLADIILSTVSIWESLTGWYWRAGKFEIFFSLADRRDSPARGNPSILPRLTGANPSREGDNSYICSFAARILTQKPESFNCFSDDDGFASPVDISTLDDKFFRVGRTAPVKFSLPDGQQIGANGQSSVVVSAAAQDLPASIRQALIRAACKIYENPAGKTNELWLDGPEGSVFRHYNLRTGL